MTSAFYNAELGAGSLLITESRKVAALILKGATDSDWQHFIHIDNELQKRSPSSTKRQTRLLRNRLEHVPRELLEIVVSGSNEASVQAILAAAINQIADRLQDKDVLSGAGLGNEHLPAPTGSCLTTIMYILNVYTQCISISRKFAMTYARIFQSGNSQAVRLPKEFRFEVDQVEIFRRGDEIVLRERPASATTIFDTLAELPEDFMAEGRQDTPPQEREHF